jgi:polynucleotide 5'-kinase involved in rRNA processing
VTIMLEQPTTAGRWAPARAVQAARKTLADAVAEVDDCPASRHRHTVRGWREDGCRCPSTRKAYEKQQEVSREASRRYRQRKIAERLADPNVANVDLRLADRIDAEAIAQGYRMPRADINTRALAVKLMRQANPRLTDRQVAWKLDAAGQGRYVTTRDGERRYEAVSVRQVQRIQAALDWKELKHPHRAGSRLDRSGRTR